MAKTRSFTLGESVSVDGEDGYTVVKVMKSSCKVEKDGKTTIKPMALLVQSESAEGVEDETPAKTSRKRASTKEVKTEKAEPKKHRDPVEDAKSPNPSSSRKRSTASSKRAPKKTFEKNNSEKEGVVVDDEDTKPVKKSAPARVKKEKSAPDAVAKALANADTPTKMIAAVKGHKAYKFINVESFKKTVAQKNDLPSGLFRMRLGNLLRGAIKRAGK